MIPRWLITPIIYNIGTFLRAGAGEAAETRSQFHPRKKNNKNNPQITEYLHKAHCRIFGLRLSHASHADLEALIHLSSTAMHIFIDKAKKRLAWKHKAPRYRDICYGSRGRYILIECYWITSLACCARHLVAEPWPGQ